MLSKKALKAFALLLYFIGLSVPLFSSCGCASCPLDTHRDLEKGKWQLGLDFESIVQDAVYVGSTPSNIGAISEHHDEVETVNDTWILSGQYAWSNQWSFGIALPLVHKKHFHIHNHHNHTTGEVEIINETWNYTGLGDLSLNTQYTWLQNWDGWTLQTSAALKLPTGATEMYNGDGDEAEVSIQPGSGSYDTTWGLHLEKTVLSYTLASGDYASLPLKIGYQYICPGSGTDSWKNGNKAIVSAGTDYMLSKTSTLGIDFYALFIDKAEAGTTREDISNTGGKWLFFSPSLHTQINDQLSYHITAQMPLYRNVNGIQITSDLNVRMGVTLEI